MVTYCPFCAMFRNEAPRPADWNIEPTGLGKHRIASFTPLNPVTPGHRLFVPQLHVDRATVLPQLTGHVFQFAAEWAASQYSDHNLIVNNGLAATQTVPHLHVHYVPRVALDGLHLPWTGQQS